MDRSIAARLGRPSAAPSSRSRARPARAAAGGGSRRDDGRARALGGGLAVARAARATLASLLARRRLRIALLGVLVALAVLLPGWLWLRSSPLVAVTQVQVSGVHGPQAGAIAGALSAAARSTSTLAVDHAALRAAVAPFIVVREVRATPSFPHGLHIEVIEQLPIAALLVGSSRTAVAADGVVLGPALLSSSLPLLAGSYEPAPGQRLHSPIMLASLAALGAAPAELAGLVARVFVGADGVTVAMRNGLLAYFGDASRLHAKWLSLARVLADPSSAGASYIDVRLPERPAAGFPAGVTPPDAASAAGAPASPGSASGAEPAVAELAAGLSPAGGASATGGQAAVGAAPAVSQPASTRSEPAASPAQETTSTPAGEPTSAAVSTDG